MIKTHSSKIWGGMCLNGCDTSELDFRWFMIYVSRLFNKLSIRGLSFTFRCKICVGKVLKGSQWSRVWWMCQERSPVLPLPKPCCCHSSRSVLLVLNWRAKNKAIRNKHHLSQMVPVSGLVSRPRLRHMPISYYNRYISLSVRACVFKHESAHVWF